MLVVSVCRHLYLLRKPEREPGAPTVCRRDVPELQGTLALTFGPLISLLNAHEASLVLQFIPAYPSCQPLTQSVFQLVRGNHSVSFKFWKKIREQLALKVPEEDEEDKQEVTVSLAPAKDASLDVALVVFFQQKFVNLLH